MKLRVWITIALGGAFFGASTKAETQERLPAEWVIEAGVLNVLHDDEDEQWMGGLEYRLPEVKWGVRPWVGVAHAEEGTTLVSAGLIYTFKARSGWRLSAGWAPTYYDRGGGKDLGGDLEFYTFGEVGYEFRNHHALGLRFGHLSNGGFCDRNPGTETLMLSYSLPLAAGR